MAAEERALLDGSGDALESQYAATAAEESLCYGLEGTSISSSSSSRGSTTVGAETVAVPSMRWSERSRMIGSKMRGTRKELRRLFVGVEESGASRDLLVASWLFLAGSAVFTLCVAEELMEDLKSLSFWMLTLSGLLFCAGSAFFIRAFAREAPTVVLYNAGAPKTPNKKRKCGKGLERHFATDLLVASWLFLLACVPVVVASVCYVVDHDDRLYFWGVLAGSVAFCIASGFFVVASYPEHLGAQNHILPKIAVDVFRLDPDTAQRHCGSEWIVSNWCFLLLTFGWLASSVYFVLRNPWDPDYQFSTIEAIIYFIASVYFVKGSYVAQAEADAFYGGGSSSCCDDDDDDDDGLPSPIGLSDQWPSSPGPTTLQPTSIRV